MDGQKEILLISVGARGGEGEEIDIRDFADLLNTLWDWMESTEEKSWDERKAARRAEEKTSTVPLCQEFA